jgi:hypothetical protein
MTRNEVARLVEVALSACGQGQHMTVRQVESLVNAWELLIGDLTYPRASAALATLLQSSPYLPAVADIRRLVLELERGPVRTGADAWGDVHRAMSRFGSHRTPGLDFHFDDPDVAALVRSFGWRELCASDNAVADRARFIDAYEQSAAQRRREAQAPALGAAAEARASARALVQNVASSLASASSGPPAIDPGDRPPWEDADGEAIH